jgi:aspartate racemase
LFCVHALGGNVLNYVPLARSLGADQPVFGVQAVGLDGVTAPLMTIEEMAARYLQEIRARSPQGPYYLCGGSMGGLIALELAQRLHAANQSVVFLGLFDTYGPGDGGLIAAQDGALARWRNRWLRVRELDPPARRLLISEAMQRRVYRGCDAVQSAWHRWRGIALPHGVRYRELERIHLRADESYRPRPYDGPVTLFRAMEQPEPLKQSWALGWETVIRGGMRVIDLPGSHDTLIEQPELARALRQELASARRAEGLDAIPTKRRVS